MVHSINAINIIKQFESLRLIAYLCPAGVWTIGYGHTRNVKKGDSISLGEAINYLNEDVQLVDNQLKPYLENIKLNQNEYDAIVSFVFNVGIGNFERSKVFKNIKNMKQEYFLNWVYGGDGSKNKIDDDCDGIVDEPGERLRLPGLITRRYLEYNLFIKQF